MKPDIPHPSPPNDEPEARLLTDPLGVVFYMKDRERDGSSPSFIAAEAAFQSGMVALDMAGVDVGDGVGLAEALVERGQLPGRVVIRTRSESEKYGEEALWMGHVFFVPVIAGMIDMGILPDERTQEILGNTFNSASEHDRSNAKLLKFLGESGNIVEEREIPQTDGNNPFIEYVLKTPYDGITGHLSIEKGKEGLVGKMLDIAEFAYGISPEAYAKRFRQQSTPLTS